MGVLSRFTNYIKTVMSPFLDRAEDPGQTLDYSYEKQLEQLQNLRRSIADVVTNEKRLELQEAQINAQIDKLRRSGAPGALDRAMKTSRAWRWSASKASRRRFATFDQQIEQLKAQQEKFVEMQQRLTTRVEAFRTQKEMVKAQYGAAQAQVKIQEAATGISEEMPDVNLAVQRAQDKVLADAGARQRAGRADRVRHAAGDWPGAAIRSTASFSRLEPVRGRSAACRAEGADAAASGPAGTAGSGPASTAADADQRLRRPSRDRTHHDGEPVSPHR